MLHGVVVEEIAGLEVVGGVENDVGSLQQIMNVAGNEICDVSMDLDLAVEGRDLALCRVGLGTRIARVRLVEEDLALQIALLDKVAVDEGQGSHAAARQQTCCRRPGGAHAHHGHMGALDPGLALGTNAGEQDLARVPFLHGLRRRRHLSVV